MVSGAQHCRLIRRLDRGEGKDLDLEELPRERLEKERIT